MNIRIAHPCDSHTLARLACNMWSDDLAAHEQNFSALIQSPEAVCFLACADENAIGFAQCQLRHDYVEGCTTSPVGFLEGVWVDPAHRRGGVASALVSACEAWARSKGCTEFASDCELDNTDSLLFHLNVGFEEAGRTIWFAKKL